MRHYSVPSGIQSLNHRCDITPLVYCKTSYLPSSYECCIILLWCVRVFVCCVPCRLDSMAGPLIDGMVVSRRTLSALVRQTTGNMCSRHRVENEGCAPPSHTHTHTHTHGYYHFAAVFTQLSVVMHVPHKHPSCWVIPFGQVASGNMQQWPAGLIH